MRNLYVYPYKMGSSSARELAGALNSRRVYPNRRYRPRPSHVVLNWGSTAIPEWYEHVDNVRWINFPESISRTVNKRIACEIMHDAGVPVVPFTTERRVANEWLQEGTSAIERGLLTSHSGKGIRLVAPGEKLQAVPLYTKYLGQRREYRVHVFDNEVIYVQQKKRRNNTEQNDVIRNYDNGWVYSHKNITPMPEGVEQSAIHAVDIFNLHFGAVDIITRHDQHYVLEINCAPGIGGDTTLQAYVNAIRRYADEL